MLIYATSADLETFTGTPAPANADRLLKGASALVRVATRTALYDVDAAGLPTDADEAEAFRDATCAQAAEWAGRGIDPGSTTIPDRVKGSSIGDGNVTYESGGGLSDADTLHQLVPDALWYLDSAGLLNGQPIVWG